MTEPTTLLAFDVGAKRIGVAVGNALTGTATALMAGTIAIEMVAAKDGRMLFQDRALSARGDYEPGREADGRRKALELLVTTIVDKAQSQW